MSSIQNAEIDIASPERAGRALGWRVAAAGTAAVEIVFTAGFWFLCITLGPPLTWPMTPYVWTAQVANGAGCLVGLVVLSTALVVLVRNLIDRGWARLFLAGAIAVNVGDVIWHFATFGLGYWAAPLVTTLLAAGFAACCLMYWRRAALPPSNSK